MAERRDRITIISVSVAIFSAMSLLCGMATNFWQILLCPVGVGIGEAGVQAPSASLIGDHFPPHRRSFALTIMRLGAPVGSLFGSILAAWIARDHGWRAALMAICALGLIVARAFRLLLRDPPRGIGDNAPAHAAPQPPPGMGAVFGMMMRRAAFHHMLIGLALASMALYAGSAFTTPFFMRAHGLPLTHAALYLAIISMDASTAGICLGGFGMDFIARRGSHWYALLPFGGIAISIPLYLVGYSLGNPLPALIALTIAGIFLFFHSVPTLVAFQNLVPANMRTTAAFIYFFVSTLIGLGFGLPLLGLASDLFAGHALPDFGTVCTAARLTGVCAEASSTGVRCSPASPSMPGPLCITGLPRVPSAGIPTSDPSAKPSKKVTVQSQGPDSTGMTVQKRGLPYRRAGPFCPRCPTSHLVRNKVSQCRAKVAQPRIERAPLLEPILINGPANLLGARRPDGTFVPIE